MTKEEYTESITFSCSPEMKKRAEESDWPSKSAYVRRMILAGESRVATLDPRTSDDHEDGEKSVKSTDDVETATQTLNDTVLLNQLNNDPQSIADILEEPTREFQTVLANRLDSLVSNDTSPVERHPLEEGYYIETGNSNVD